MLRIDPRTHSACSDGTDSPSQLMVEATRAGLDYVGLSNYGTFAGWDETGAATSSTSVALVRGMEMSYAASGINVHLLALLPDPSNEGLLTYIERVRESHTTRALKMMGNLSADYPITWEQVLAFTPEEGPVGRPHTADTLIAVGAFDDHSVAFVKALYPSSPYYVRHWASDSIEAVQLVLEAGGVPVLAHPKTRVRQRLLPESVIEDIEEAGLSGIERDYRDHTPENREVVDRIAKRLDLRVFGSSDYHGTGKPDRIEENLTASVTIDEAVERAYLEVLHPR